MVPYTAAVRDNGRGLFRCDNVYDDVMPSAHDVTEENSVESAGFDYAPWPSSGQLSSRAQKNVMELRNKTVLRANITTARMLATQFERSGNNGLTVTVALIQILTPFNSLFSHTSRFSINGVADARAAFPCFDEPALKGSRTSLPMNTQSLSLSSACLSLPTFCDLPKSYFCGRDRG